MKKKKYEYVWLPDDDLYIKKKNIEDLFMITKKLNLKISQPSLRVPEVNIDDQINVLNHYDLINWSSNKYIGWLKYYEKNKNFITDQITSYISYKILLQKYPNNQKMIRYTNFVEIMCPLIEISFFLKKIFYLMDSDHVQSGFGLDSIWSHICKYKNMAIIDFIPVIHTRPVGNFQKKKTGNFKALNLDPKIEIKLTFNKYKKNFKLKNIYKKILEEKTLNNPKLCYLFIVDNDVNNPKLWKEYFDNNFDKCNIFLISKTRKVNSFFKKFLVNEFVEHNKFYKIKSILKLIELSYKNGLNKYFIILNQDSIPKYNFNYTYNILVKSDKSFLSYKKIYREDEKINNILKKKYFYKSKFESILNRKHSKLVLDQKNKNLYFFNDFKHPEYIYNINIININLGLKEIIKKNILI